MKTLQFLVSQLYRRIPHVWLSWVCFHWHFLSPHRKTLQLNWTGTAESALFPQANFPGMRFSPSSGARLFKKISWRSCSWCRSCACAVLVGRHCFAKACTSCWDCLRGSCVVFKSRHTSYTHTRTHRGWTSLVGSWPQKKSVNPQLDGKDTRGERINFPDSASWSGFSY